MEASSSSSKARRKSGANGRGNGAPPAKSQKKDASQKRSGSKSVLESFNPATGELIGSVETLTPAKVQAVIDDVAEVQPFWAALTLEDRARYMRRACDVLLEDMDDLAELLTNEQGKPRVESYTMELLPTVDSLKWIAENGPEILADEKQSMPIFLKSKSAKFTYEPIGVVGVIAPWNYPWSIPFGEVAIALMAGNGVVLKPASLTPLIGERIRQTFEKAGLPEGLVRTVHGGGRIGDALVKSTAGKIFFTGSVEVGRKVGVECAKRLKGSVLELGGKDPQIVCADADLANAVSGAVWGGFANAGQTCSGIERVYVHRDVADAFVEGVVRETERLTVGDPRDWTTEIGPMVSDEQAKIVEELVEDAVENGATKLTGGPTKVDGTGTNALRGSFIAPVVLTGVTHEMRIMKEEIFGPVLPVITVDSEQEAIDLANDSEFGLGASVWTKDRAKGERMAHQIQSGMVWTNDHSFSHGACVCAWGGVKDSGLGRSHSKFGFYECVNIKQLAWEPGWARDMWWQPYDRTLGDAIRYSAQLLYSRNGNRLQALREGIRPLVEVTRRTMRKGA
ncbi:MAG TPA: aldehyde dehydrogenase family protein [Solirubrobacterales bacterium]